MKTARYVPTKHDKFYEAIESKNCRRVDANTVCSQGICFESTYFDGDKEIGKIHSITYFKCPYVKDSKIIKYWICK